MEHLWMDQDLFCKYYDLNPDAIVTISQSKGCKAL